MLADGQWECRLKTYAALWQVSKSGLSESSADEGSGYNEGLHSDVVVDVKRDVLLR